MGCHMRADGIFLHFVGKTLLLLLLLAGTEYVIQQGLRSGFRFGHTGVNPGGKVYQFHFSSFLLRPAGLDKGIESVCVLQLVGMQQRLEKRLTLTVRQAALRA